MQEYVKQDLPLGTVLNDATEALKVSDAGQRQTNTVSQHKHVQFVFKLEQD